MPAVLSKFLPDSGGILSDDEIRTVAFEGTKFMANVLSATAHSTPIVASMIVPVEDFVFSLRSGHGFVFEHPTD